MNKISLFELILSNNIFFKGNGTNIVRIIPYTAVQFAAYEEFKKVGLELSKLVKLFVGQ